jgi:hypothetical protein
MQLTPTRRATAIAALTNSVAYYPRSMSFARRFPPPWSVEETDACFIVHDANGHAFAYVYFEATFLLTGSKA